MNPRANENRRTSNTRQRKKQQHLLDVKIRASTERSRRISTIFSVTCKVILFTGLIVGAWIGGKEALRRFLWENPDYFLREVKVSTDGTLTRDQILKASEIVEGRNIFLVKLSKAKTGIEKLPQVEGAEVTRTLPNRVSIAVTERRPIAWLVSRPDEDPTASEKSFLIDARGLVMRTKVKLEEYLNFPVISGLSTENLVPGERVTSVEMQAALELIRLTSDSTWFQTRHVDLSKGYCLIVTDHKHARITFGLDGIEPQLARLRRYVARAAEDFRELQTVNLLVERNTPVTFNEPVAESEVPVVKPPVDPKPKPAPAATVKAATPIPRALAITTPAPAATPAATPTNNLLSAFRSKPTPTPAARKPSDGVKKQPFRLHN